MNYLLRLVSIIKKNLIFSLSATGALSLHLFFAWLPLERLEGFTFPWSKGPLIDDSYIFFTISRDLADWFSGILPSPHLTSGFQPLIALLYTPFFQLFWNNKELPIHCALSLNALLGFFAHISLYCLLRKIVSRCHCYIFGIHLDMVTLCDESDHKWHGDYPCLTPPPHYLKLLLAD